MDSRIGRRHGQGISVIEACCSALETGAWAARKADLIELSHIDEKAGDGCQFHNGW